MFRVKICGITNREDAVTAADSGADAVGLNFFDGSPRCVSREVAQEILKILPPQVTKVGVFVNSPASEVRKTFDDLDLDIIQLHGDEPPPMLGLFENRPVIRAFRCRDTGLDPVVEYIEKCTRLACIPYGVLIDAYYPGQYGGTGRAVDWNSVVRQRAELGNLNLVLAGGLTPANVAKGIATVQPTAVDTASGVESSPGIKDASKLQQFVKAAESAFTALLDSKK